MFSENKENYYYYISASQVTGLEQYDSGKISGGSDFQIMSRPDNDPTNAWSFLCLGIIDRFSSENLQTFDMEQFAGIVESITLNFSREVNKFAIVAWWLIYAKLTRFDPKINYSVMLLTSPKQAYRNSWTQDARVGRWTLLNNILRKNEEKKNTAKNISLYVL